MERISKQVLVMRKKFIGADGKEFSMRKGKMIAQGAHAAMAALLNLNRGDSDSIVIHLREDDSAIRDWIRGRFTKICVSVDTEVELLEVYNKAKNKGLICSLITDAGLTEFNGVPTVTCCAVGPAWADEVDEITGKLQLL